jgi:hypothetical protein
LGKTFKNEIQETFSSLVAGRPTVFFIRTVSTVQKTLWSRPQTKIIWESEEEKEKSEEN